MKIPPDPAPIDFRPERLLSQSRYESVLGVPSSWKRQGTLVEVRRHLRQAVPAAAGVYALFDADRQLMYVGMSKRLSARLTCYFSSDNRRRKERRIGKRTRYIVWQPAAHTLVAALRERELIQTFRPPLNVQGHPSRVIWGAIILSDLEAPHFQLQPEVPKRHRGVWGPIPITHRMKHAVEQINLHFLLRDCPATTPMYFQKARSKGANEAIASGASGCLRVDLQSCLAPCVGNCGERQYLAAVSAAKEFLNGDSEKCLGEIRKAMQQAAECRHFEKAATLRDRREIFEGLAGHLGRFHAWTRRASFIYRAQSDLDPREWWFVFQAGVLVSALPAPKTAKDRAVARVQLLRVRATLKQNGGQSASVTTHEFTAARLLYRWFRLNPSERDQLLTLQAGIRFCRIRKPRSSGDSSH